MLKDFVTTWTPLQELLKEELNMEKNKQYQQLQKHTKLKDHQCYEEIASTNGQNKQLAS